MTSGSSTDADLLADVRSSLSLDRDARRTLVARTAAPALDGIDAIEVLANAPGSPRYTPGAPRQRTLLVRLLRGPVPTDLTANRVRVLGGVRPDPRTNPVRVLWAYPAAAVAGDDLPPGVTSDDRGLVIGTTDPADRAGVLVVRTSSSGDWSTYVLTLSGPGGVGVPTGFDEPLAQAPFTFTVDCPSDLDCRVERECPPAAATSPVLDYLARDYDALRTRLLDRMSALLPDWADRNPADPAVTIVELFAAVGDRLAAWQDGVAAEAYLSTARRRTSVRRHARLLDYRAHEGCSARSWLAFTTGTAFTLPAGTPVADPSAPGGPPATGPVTAAEVIEAGGTVFETCSPARLLPGRNALALHSWGDPDYYLPVGATSAFVARTPAAPDPQLRAGDVLVLVPLGPDGTAATGDPTRRQAVRLERAIPHSDPLSTRSVVLELHWSDADALSVPLPVAERSADGSARIVAAALANVVLADQGGTITAEPLDPPQTPVGRPYRPRLRRSGLAFADPPPAGVLPAAAVAVPDPHRALAQLELDDGARTWLPRTDLLGSSRLAPHVVVETEPGQPSRLRFGDGVTGRHPDPGTTMTATYRLGGGRAGNVGPDVLTRLLAAPGGSALPDGVGVTNPLPALGGTEPQPLAEVRELAPHAFRTQLRAVTPADYADVAMADPAVQRAVARRRWTGSWYTQEVTVDALGGGPVPAHLGDVLEVRRMAGTDVELAQPVAVALEIVLGVCVVPGYQRADVAAGLTRAFSARRLPSGGQGFFHPDNFTFGQPLFLSDVVATAIGVPGVAWVDVGDDDTGLRFRRLGRPPAGEAARGRIDAAAREVLRADSDPSNPENGRVGVLMRGRP